MADRINNLVDCKGGAVNDPIRPYSRLFFFQIQRVQTTGGFGLYGNAILLLVDNGSISN